VSDYYPMGEIEFTYLSNSANFLRITMKKSTKKGQYSISDSQGWTHIHERNSNGVYALSAELLGQDPSYKYTYKNWLVVPNTLKLGGVVTVESILDGTLNNRPEDDFTEKATRSIQLVEISTAEWKGKDYPAITLEFTIKYSSFQDNIYRYKQTFLKGLGPLEQNEYKLESVVVTSLDKPIIEPDNNSGASGKKSGGGGSIGYLTLLLLASYIVVGCVQRKK
jgi:hypothetical protein